MTQNTSTVRRKEKDETKRRKKKKEKRILHIYHILHISHILSTIMCRLYLYINYFIFIIYYRHGNWFIGL